jgi:hypothetical protein
MRSRLWARTVAAALLMRSRLWTRAVAAALLFFLFLLTAFFAFGGPSLKFPSAATSAVLVVIQAATATIAVFMPLSSKDEARRKMRAAMSQYVVLDSLMVIKPDDKGRVLNRVVNRMRVLAEAACFRQEEIKEYLESADVGERAAALACVQWQWRPPNDEPRGASCGRRPPRRWCPGRW